jgi:uncharacterized protein (TIGR02452 family)
MDKLKAIKIAKETMSILESGKYLNRQRKIVTLSASIREAIKGAVLYSPDETDRLLNSFTPLNKYDTIIEVTSESSLAAAKRLSENDGKVCVLNFASAKNPGGGFLTGSRAQEESLARSSGLYPTIAQMKEMYEHNLRIRTGLYSDYMIFSPNVPVFRDDDGDLLDEPYFVSFITTPAVNAGLVREREPHKAHLINEVMKRRIEKILVVAFVNQQNTLILGAFGCGVFKNRPEDVATIFRDTLTSDRFKGVFKKIIFAVYDPTPQKLNYNIFRRVLK